MKRRDALTTIGAVLTTSMAGCTDAFFSAGVGDSDNQSTDTKTPTQTEAQTDTQTTRIDTAQQTTTTEEPTTTETETAESTTTTTEETPTETTTDEPTTESTTEPTTTTKSDEETTSSLGGIENSGLYVSDVTSYGRPPDNATVEVTVTNSSDRDISDVTLACLFFDESRSIVAELYGTTTTLGPDESTQGYFDVDHDSIPAVAYQVILRAETTDGWIEATQVSTIQSG